MSTALRNPLGIVPAYAEAAVADGQILTVGAADNNVAVQGATPGASAPCLGMSVNTTSAAGATDMVMLGIWPGIAGGSITRGDALTSDASGHCVTAAPAGGTNIAIIGFARASAVAGDRVPVQIAPQILQG
jgi:hypothetical protein